MDSILHKNLLGNPMSDWLWFAGIMVFGLLFKAYGSKILSRWFFRFFSRFSSHDYSKEFAGLLRKPFELLFLILTIIIAFEMLTVPIGWVMKVGKTRYHIDDVLIASGKVALILSIAWVFLRTADFIGFVFLQKAREHNGENDGQLSLFFKDVIKVLIAISCLLFVLGAVFHLNITSLITGLGIGGLAIALAAQETIANLIGSFVIFLDKPFTVGETVENADIKGTVESVGFRSTRIRTFDKTLLTVPNKKLVDSALNNISRNDNRRVKFNLALATDSPRLQLVTLIADIEKLIGDHPETTDNFSIKFDEINTNALVVQVIYFVNGPDQDHAADVKQDIYFKILELIDNSTCRLAPPQIGKGL